MKQTVNNWQSVEHNCGGTSLPDSVAVKEKEVEIKWVPANGTTEGHVTVDGVTISPSVGGGSTSGGGSTGGDTTGGDTTGGETP